ncbi:helix-turn-helix transcriptional regulator [Paenibacillus lycopersici]|uniref:Helix-turn-helix transcriptional regulator n=1 Tax=Paenibacillus lycopersici TaxID=2704462 RepID=A0A6C0FN65_9BACL|nr:helix-turn-helix domain-containing protein [Paenibacillus lycopersici]QHT58576.1 helix-turn-helix transcriptional regulator [Paenibacillus lycopersici]
MNIEPGNCKVATALEAIVGKWKISIMLNLLDNHTMRFSELQHAMPGVTRKMLTAHLRELEEEGLIKREVFPQVPPKVEYSMTEYGATLKNILALLHEWGESHLGRKQQG